MNNWLSDSFLRKLEELLTEPTVRLQRDIMDIPQKNDICQTLYDQDNQKICCAQYL